MQLPAQAQQVYKDWWQLVSYAAAQRDESGSYSYLTTDLTQAAAAIARAEGRTLAFSDFTGLAQLFGIARSMEHSADSLNQAPDSARITAAMISDSPWSRSLDVRNAAPTYQLRTEITYRAPDGSIITTYATGVFPKVLPTTVGALRAEAQLQIARMLSQRSDLRNTGGELLSIGRATLLAV